jgi:hypothetical protein
MTIFDIKADFLSVRDALSSTWSSFDRSERARDPHRVFDFDLEVQKILKERKESLEST